MIKTICYGKVEKWKSREEAEKSFLEAIRNSEGSEQLRYMNVYTNLRLGKDVATDELD